MGQVARTNQAGKCRFAIHDIVVSGAGVGTRLITVISERVPSRMIGPQQPVPGDT